MSDAVRILHGSFGRVALLKLDHSMVLHAHRDCHIVFKVGGPDILFGVGAHEHAVTAENVLMINAWEPHFYKHRNGPVFTVLLAFYLSPFWLKDVDRRFAQSTHPKFFTRPMVHPSHRLIQMRDDVLDSLKQYEPPSTRVIEDLIAAVFAEIMILTAPLSHLSPVGAHRELGYDARIRQVVQSMLAGAGSPVVMEELARSVGLSRAHFFRLFQRSTGLAPMTFLNMHRMETCLKSVARREMPLQDIAAQLGFDTAGNFTRFFAGQQGVTPSKYRKAVGLVDSDKPKSEERWLDK